MVTREGDLFVVEDPKYGRLPVLPGSSNAPTYASYRSERRFRSDARREQLHAGRIPVADSGGRTQLRVVESGFAALAQTDDAAAEPMEDTIDGWETQLDFAKRDAERGDA